MEFSHTPQKAHKMPRKIVQVIAAEVAPVDNLVVAEIELSPVVEVEKKLKDSVKRCAKPRAKKVLEPVIEEVVEAEPAPVVVAEKKLKDSVKRCSKPRAKKVVEAVIEEVVEAEPVTPVKAPAAGERSAQVAEPGAPVKPKRTRKPSAYNMLLGEFMRKIAQEEDKIPRNERMAKAQMMYKDHFTRLRQEV